MLDTRSAASLASKADVPMTSKCADVLIPKQKSRDSSRFYFILEFARGKASLFVRDTVPVKGPTTTKNKKTKYIKGGVSIFWNLEGQNLNCAGSILHGSP